MHTLHTVVKVSTKQAAQFRVRVSPNPKMKQFIAMSFREFKPQNLMITSVISWTMHGCVFLLDMCQPLSKAQNDRIRDQLLKVQNIIVTYILKVGRLSVTQNGKIKSSMPQS